MSDWDLQKLQSENSEWTLGDSFGKPTSHSQKGSSVVDYIIWGQELTQTIENFIVKPPTYLSDHSQLVTWIKRAPTHVPISETTHTQQPKTHRLPQQFIWDNDSMTEFTENFKLNKIFNIWLIPIHLLQRKVSTCLPQK
jgi:hypothetical protein